MVRPSTATWVRIALLLTATLALGACSLAGDITPPPGIATAQAQGIGLPATAAPPTAPRRMPNPTAGETVFADKCAPCHGASGDGQGPQASALPNPPSALRAAEVAQRAVPLEWFAIVTEGRIESFMPGFTSLSDDERWDVVGYALSLGLESGNVEAGRDLYQQECVECHGPLGRGTGSVPDLTAPEYQSDHSLLAIQAAISQGVGQGMPGYADTLSDDERWSLAAYVRALGLALSPKPTAPPPSDTPEATDSVPATSSVDGSPETATAMAVPAAGQGRITGTVSNGTAGAAVPAGLDVTLHGLDGDQEVVTLTQRLGPDGRFAFEGLEATTGRAFVVTADYGDVLYASDIGEFGTESAALDLPLRLFETTQATEAVEVSRLHLLFEFPAEDVVRVVELWLLSNLGDRTVVGDASGAIEVRLPPDASGLSLDGGTIGERFERTPDGFRDRGELVPGENTGELVFSYILPYDGDLEIVREHDYPVAATIAMISGEGPRIVGDGFNDTGVRQVTGAALHSYERAQASAGEPIRLNLRGRPAASSTGGAGVAPAAFGAAALALALVGAGLIWFRPRSGRRPIRPRAPTNESAPDADRTLWAIASLDNEYAAGKIDLATYQARRSELVRRAEGRAP